MIGGSLGLTKNGAGTQTLTGSSSYTGATRVSGGVLQLGSNGSAGDLPGTSGVTVDASGTLAIARSDSYSFGKAIGGQGGVRVSGSGTVTLGVANSYSGATSVTAGTLVYGVAGAVPAASALTVDAAASLNLADLAVTRTGATTLNGPVALGATGNATLTFDGGTHTVSDVSGAGALVLKNNAVVTLTKSISSASLSIQIGSGATLVVAAGKTVSVGTLTQASSAAIDLSGTATLAVATLTISGGTLSVNNWSAGAAHLTAAGITGNPVQNVMNQAPLTSIVLGSNAASASYWANTGEILASTASLFYWDGAGTAGNGGVGGGTGNWDATTTNWTASDGSVNGAWVPGATARFAGTAGTVTVSGTVAAGNLYFDTAGYTITGGTQLGLTAGSTITTVGNATIATPLVVPGALTVVGGGVLTVSGLGSSAAGLTVQSGTLRLGRANLALVSSSVTVQTGATLDLGGFNQSIGNPLGTGTITGSSGELAVSPTYPLTFNGTITGGVALKVLGNQGMTLAGTHTYTGTTVLSAPAFIYVTGSTAPESAVTVGSSTVLGGSGTLAGPVTVNGTIAPSTPSGGVASMSTGSLTVASTATVQLTAGTPGTVGGGVNSLIQVSGDLQLNGRLAIASGTGFSTTGNYTLITYTGTRTGTFSTTNLASIGYQGVVSYDDANKRVLLVSLPRVRLSQTSNSGTGTFGFVLVGLDSSNTSLVTTASGVAVTSTVFNGTAGTAVTLTQTPPTGWPTTPLSISCVDANGATTGNGSGNLGTVSGAGVTLPAAKMVAGADITCSFVNTLNSIGGTVFNDGGAPSGGSNTGTPNDGLRNGAEGGIAGLTVALTNCAGSTYASATTDGAGAFSFAVPTAANGQTVCVQAAVASGYLSTGANVNGTVTPDGSATTVGGVSYTYSRSQSLQSFVAATAGQQVLNFGQVAASSLTPTSVAATASAGSKSYGNHIFTAGTGGSLQVMLGAPTATPANGGWSETVYLDPGCTGSVQSGATVLAPGGTARPVVQGDVVCMVVQAQTPSNAGNGDTNTVPLTFTLTLNNSNPPLSYTLNATDTFTVSTSAVTLEKRVRNVTTNSNVWSVSNTAKPGETLEYRISYRNSMVASISGFVISDSVPPYTTFVSAWAESGTPASLGTCSKVTPANPPPDSPKECSVTQTVGGTGSITWTFSGSLPSGGSGAVLYRVKVN